MPTPSDSSNTAGTQRNSGLERDGSHSSQNTRFQLLSAAIEVIERDGIDSLRIEDVCRRVGVSKGSLYWHFGDRIGLIREALLEQVHRLGGELIDALGDAIDEASSYDDYLERISHALVDPFDRAQVESRWQRLELITKSRRDADLLLVLSDVQQRHFQLLKDLMEKGAAHGFLRKDVDPGAVAAIIIAVGMGSNMISLLGGKSPTREQWGGLIAVLISALFPDH